MGERETYDLREQEEHLLQTAILNALNETGSTTDYQFKALSLNDIGGYIKSVPTNPNILEHYKSLRIHDTTVNPNEEEQYYSLLQMSSVCDSFKDSNPLITVYFVDTNEALAMIVLIPLDRATTNVNVHNVGENRTSLMQKLYERASEEKTPDLCLISAEELKRKQKS